MIQLFILTLLASEPSPALTRQDRIDYSALKIYESRESQDHSLMPVDNGYLVSNSKLQSYIEIKDDNWKAESNGKLITATSSFSRIKSFFTDFLQLKNHADATKNNSVSEDEVNKMRLRRQNAVRLGLELKSTVANYQNGQVFKIQNLKTCSEHMISLQGTLDNHPFKVTVDSSKSAPFIQSVKLESNGITVEESEEFHQVGSFRLGVYKKMEDYNKATSTLKPNLIQNFASQLVKNRKLAQVKTEELKNSITQAWKLSKRLAGCCADRTCRDAFQSRQTQPASGGLLPYTTR